MDTGAALVLLVLEDPAAEGEADEAGAFELGD